MEYVLDSVNYAIFKDYRRNLVHYGGASFGSVVAEDRRVFLFHGRCGQKDPRK